jgi:hypothetical protein
MAAFTWVDLDEFGMSCSRFPLNSNEAYLFDAYTLPLFRGKNMAPCLRYHVYKELEKAGKKGFTVSPTASTYLPRDSRKSLPQDQ